MLPYSVGAILECVTEKRAHLLQEIRKLLRDNGGMLKASSYLFERKGRVVFEKTDTVGVEDILERAIEVGALEVDVSPDGNLFVDTEPLEVHAVAQKLTKMTNLNIETASVIYDPKVDTALRLKEDETTELERVVALLEDEHSVQDVYVNVM
jgi:transcriptional/translational regulatory protein YebC/TACO1